MITFDSLTLKAFVSEQKEFLTGARIYKIQQPTRRELLLTVRNNGENRQLYINIDPQFFHICFSSKENLEKKHIEIPSKPPMFCMLLRKYISNGKIAKIKQPEHERIFEIYLETYNEIGEKTYLCLAIELMGKYSNIILYNYDTNIILGCAHNVGAEKSRARELFGTIPYSYPPKQVKTDISTFNDTLNNTNLSQTFYDISIAFESLLSNTPFNKIKDYTNLHGVKPAISKDFRIYSLFEELLTDKIIQQNVNSMIDNYYSFHIQNNKIKIQKSNNLTIVNSRLKKTIKTLKQMDFQLKKNESSDKYRLYGDLLMANLYSLKDYTKFAQLFDYENNQNIKIDLDETKTIKENANNFYKLYTKSKTANHKINELYIELRKKQDYLQSLAYSINISNSIEELLEIKEEIQEQNSSQKKSHSTPIKIILENETTIYIGKNNKQNNYIISKLANEDDLWFHVKDCAGSHVLLKTQKLTDELIIKCANYAKQYSSVSESLKAAVIYTKRKYVKKPPKSPLGYVTYRNEKEIIV